MTYTGLSDIVAEMKGEFLYHVRKEQLNLVHDGDKRSINTVVKVVAEDFRSLILCILM